LFEARRQSGLSHPAGVSGTSEMLLASQSQ
jgi:hypothetical protein